MEKKIIPCPNWCQCYQILWRDGLPQTYLDGEPYQYGDNIPCEEKSDRGKGGRGWGWEIRGLTNYWVGKPPCCRKELHNRIWKENGLYTWKQDWFRLSDEKYTWEEGTNSLPMGWYSQKKREYTTLSKPVHINSKQCQCHLILWDKGPGNYTYLDGSPYEQYDGIACADKYNEFGIDIKECQYIPGKSGSKFPLHVFYHNKYTAYLQKQKRLKKFEKIPCIRCGCFSEFKDSEKICWCDSCQKTGCRKELK